MFTLLFFFSEKNASSSCRMRRRMYALPLLFICFSQNRPLWVLSYPSAITGGTCRSLTSPDIIMTRMSFLSSHHVRCAARKPSSIFLLLIPLSNEISVRTGRGILWNLLCKALKYLLSSSLLLIVSHCDLE